MSRPILYSFRRCPYAMRARLAIRASGQEVELREIVLRDKAPEFLAASPKGTVPVLVPPDGTVIEESREIMDWALDLADPDHLATSDPALLTLVERADSEFKSHLDRYKYAVRYDGVDPVEERTKASIFLHDLDALLGQNRYLGGATQAQVDLAIAPFVRQFANVDRAWFDAQDWPHLLRWLQDFLDSAAFAAIMTKYPKWQAGDPVTLFPKAEDAP